MKTRKDLPTFLFLEDSSVLDCRAHPAHREIKKRIPFQEATRHGIQSHNEADD
jgi:hypothetical protein